MSCVLVPFRTIYMLPPCYLCNHTKILIKVLRIHVWCLSYFLPPLPPSLPLSSPAIIIGVHQTRDGASSLVPPGLLSGRRRCGRGVLTSLGDALGAALIRDFFVIIVAARSGELRRVMHKSTPESAAHCNCSTTPAGSGSTTSILARRRRL
jgi:hypothetical protein